ncbi:MAG: zinc-binding dehydrogenase [Hyphomonadaceae bacterium]|nr:zinc-binding dehydrogenase [Hyphomonadaceae bacterium]
MGEALAAVAVRPRETELQTIALPDIAPDAGLLRVEATGVCGSDWPMYNSERGGARVLGHEMVGVIEKAGALAADRWGFKEGDRVALEEYLPCGHCEYCRSGEFRSCMSTDSRIPGAIRYGSTSVALGSGLWGGFARYLHLHPRTVMHRVPDGVPGHIAAMAIPLGNGFQWAYLDGAAGPGKTVVVQGPGQTGLACALAAKAAGADLVIMAGLKRDARRLEVARKLGADLTVAVDELDLVDEVSKATGGQMADLVIEASSAGPEILNTSIKLLRKRSMLILATRKGAIPNLDLDQLLGMQATVKGVRGHSFHSVELALRAMASGRYPLELLSTHVVGLGDVDTALRAVGGQTKMDIIHITVEPWKSEQRDPTFA